MRNRYFRRAWAASLLVALVAGSCSESGKQAPQPGAAPQGEFLPAPASSASKPDQISDEGAITAAQRALGLNNLTPQAPKTGTTTVAAGDVLLFGDGSKEIAKAERVVPWDMESAGGLVAVRPSTAGWPAAARAGLDWATSRALDAAGGPPIAWSSTGVDRHFVIQATPVLSSRETAMAGTMAQSCRHFELRGTQLQYPGIACRDANGEWYFLHSRIRLAHPPRRLQSQAGSAAKAPGR